MGVYERIAGGYFFAGNSLELKSLSAVVLSQYEITFSLFE